MSSAPSIAAVSSTLASSFQVDAALGISTSGWEFEEIGQWLASNRAQVEVMRGAMQVGLVLACLYVVLLSHCYCAIWGILMLFVGGVQVFRARV